jgi:hypothetical protein
MSSIPPIPALDQTDLNENVKQHVYKIKSYKWLKLSVWQQQKSVFHVVSSPVW